MQAGNSLAKNKRSQEVTALTSNKTTMFYVNINKSDKAC